MRVSRRQVLFAASMSALPWSLGRPAEGGEASFVLLEAEAQPRTRNVDVFAPIPVMSYNQLAPGPLLRAARGDEVRVRLRNGLDQPTSIHWQGCRVPNAMDGAAGLTQEAVGPGATFDYRFPAADSGTFLYRPGALATMGDQIEGGLGGLLVVAEPQPPACTDDLALVLRDWPGPEGAGRVLSVNADPAPLRATYRPGARLRLRLASLASNRLMIVGFEALRPQIIAIDGQPSEMFEPVRATIPLGPGARVDVLVDLPTEAGSAGHLVLRGETGTDEPIAILSVDGEPLPDWPPMAPLPANPALPLEINLAQAKKLDLLIDGGTVLRPATTPPVKSASPTDRAGKGAFASLKRGSPVSLGLVNRTASVQSLHLHGHHVRILHPLDDGWEPYWRDTMLILPGKTARIAFVADNPGKWLVESQGLGSTPVTASAYYEVA
jgi:FtsP/CotA-like multicopper oxidase with cupredoxin domain